MLNLSGNQRKACLSNGNVLINATAGSGKTTVLITRIQRLIHEGINPRNILAIAFNKKTKEEISDRLDNPLVNVATFHSLAYKVIREAYGDYYVLMNHYQKEDLITRILKDDSGELYAAAARDFSFAKAHMSEPKVFKAEYETYEKVKRLNSWIEFDDFFSIAVKVFKENPRIFEKFKNQYQYVLIDEYQDISYCQAVFMDMINSKNTMVVGDGFQAIYSFRGGSSDFLRNFPRTHENTTIVNLNENRRCSQEIVDLANILAQEIPDSRTPYYKEPVSLTGYTGIHPVYKILDNEYQEALYIAAEIRRKAFADCAVLARTNRQFEIIQKVFHDENLPFTMIDGGLFTDTPDLKLLINYLRLVYDQSDNEALEYIYNKPRRRIGEKYLNSLKEKAVNRRCSLFEAMRFVQWRSHEGVQIFYNGIEDAASRKFRSVGSLVKHLRKYFRLDDYCLKRDPDDGEIIENLDSFQEMCYSFKTIKDLLDYLQDLRSTVSENGVKLSTVHKSKGLEFDAVFVCGCIEGLFPHMRAESEDDEKRLFYVAITRAKKYLYLTGTAEYRGKTVYESPFIDMCELEETED